MSNKYILMGGYVIDGKGPQSGPVKADVAIEDDRIKAVRDLSNTRDARVIDVKGMYVCPGFIDAHAHSDFIVLADGRAEGKISQGITTEINGNCGMSAAPLYGAALEQRQKDLTELNIKERWNSFEDYFALLEKRSMALNLVTLTGHGNVRASVAGYENRVLSTDEMELALKLLQETFMSGSRGLSTGLIYPPGIYSETDEIISLARETARHGGLYTTHMRSEGDRLVESVDEVLRIGREARVHVHISHLKTSDEQNWGKIDTVLSRLANANKSDIPVTCDRYPYIASSTDLDAVLPAWAFEGGHKREMERLKMGRSELERAILDEHPDSAIWDKVVISSVVSEKNKWMEGKSLLRISEMTHKKELECLFDVLLEENLSVGAIFFTMDEDNLRTILQQPYTMIGSDSTARSYDGISAVGKPHPRGFGTFPRILGRYVREQKVLSISEAIHKMTGLPARIFRIKERGVIAEGNFADITVFDPAKINDTSQFDDPFKRPDGIHYVFINGKPVVLDSEITGVMPGRVLL